MCGRFALFDTPNDLAKMFHIGEFIEFKPSYNIAPSHQVPVLLNNMGERQSTLLTWGLLPSWAKDNKSYQINARIETVAEKPFFRAAFKSSRCLVPVSSWYEWQTIDGKKQPFCFKPEADLPVAIAGLWEHWTDGHESLHTLALITRQADSACSTIHDRMPVLVPKNYFDLWLSTDVLTLGNLNPLLQDDPIVPLKIYPVTRAVNSPKFNTEDCIRPITIGKEST